VANALLSELIACRKARDEGREQGRRQGRIEVLAAVVTDLAVGRGLEVPDDFQSNLKTYADGDQLASMLKDLNSLTGDVVVFASKHGVILPRSR
jgi:hypothetical protein